MLIMAILMCINRKSESYPLFHLSEPQGRTKRRRKLLMEAGLLQEAKKVEVTTPGKYTW